MIDESTLPASQRVLLAIDRAKGGTDTGHIAAELGMQSKAVATNAWLLQKRQFVSTKNGTHTITDAGLAAVSRIKAGEGMPRTKPERTPNAKKGFVPQASRLRRPEATALATRQDTGPRESAAAHADGLIGNALNAINLHELLLDESVELTPLVRASIDGIRRAVDLIGSAYQAARP